MFDWKKLFGQRDNKNVAISHQWKRDAALQECLNLMRGTCTVATPGHGEAVEAVVRIALAEGGWIHAEAIPEDWLSGECFILWDKGGMPIMHCVSALVLDHLDAMRAVAPDTYLVAENLDRVVHFSEGALRLWPENP